MQGQVHRALSSAISVEKVRICFALIAQTLEQNFYRKTHTSTSRQSGVMMMLGMGDDGSLQLSRK
jgi:hypothetical protein